MLHHFLAVTSGRSPNLSELCFLFVSSEDNKINLRAFPRGLNETMCRTISSLSGFIVALNKYLFFLCQVRKVCISHLSLVPGSILCVGCWSRQEAEKLASTADVECLLCACHCAEHWTRTSSFSSPNTRVSCELLSAPFSRPGNRGLERLSNLLKVTQPMS